MHALLRVVLVTLILCAAAPPAAAAWYEAKSPHFIIYSEQRPEDLRRYAIQLERFDQAVRTARSMQDPPLTDSGKLTIYVLPNERSIAALVRPGVAGVYYGRASGAVAFVHRDEGSFLEAQTVFNHEYVHHLMLQHVAVVLPAWIVEGYAEFFATAKFLDDGTVRFGAPPQHRGFGLYRSGGLSAQRLVGAKNNDFTAAEWDSIYGKGWLLAHYLTFEPSRAGQIERYINGIQSGVSALDSARAAFGDLVKLEGDLDRYLRRGTFAAADIPASSLSVGKITLRPLTDAESAIMRVRMRTARGAYGREARSIAADARKIAGRFPHDPGVLSALARAELAAENHAAALAAAERAVAAAPNSLMALVPRARASVELGRADPSRADWTSIRKMISQANRLDPDDPEPLVLFYESYVAAGERPTENSVEGLVYAMGLAPLDEDLRLLVVHQMAADGRFIEAARAFGPIAYDPHAGKKRNKVAAIMASINAGNGPQTLQQLHAYRTEIEDERKRR